MVHGTNYHPFNLLIESSAPLTDLLETYKSELKSTSISLMRTTGVTILLGNGQMEKIRNRNLQRSV